MIASKVLGTETDTIIASRLKIRRGRAPPFSSQREDNKGITCLWLSEEVCIPETKRAVYRAVVLGTLLYRAGSWTTKRYAMQKLESLHNHCLRGIFGITKVKQCVEHITSSQIRESFGMKELVEEMIVQRRLRWLGHVSRMDQSRMPKQVLFSRLRKTRPFHGVKCGGRIESIEI